jgi:hypothetical protein
MSSHGDALLIGRMATLPFALLEWCFAFWYARTLPLFSRSRLRKVTAGAMFVCVILGVL